MAPLENLNAYFQNMDKIYFPASQWANCDTQAKLNHALIKALTAVDPDADDEFVTQVAFNSVKTIVNVCLEDWPAAIGSVWEIIKIVWNHYNGTNLETIISGVLQNHPNFNPNSPNYGVTAEELAQIRQQIKQLISSGIPLTQRITNIENFLQTNFGYSPSTSY